jgi:enoyl-CoA hydratase
MHQDSPAIVTEVTNSIAIIRFNRPAERNPLSIATLQNLKRIVSTLFSCDDIQTVIFTGTNDVFASGANIRELAQLDSCSALEFANFGQALFQKIGDARPLTIAAINGYCMGGGLDLALACDIRLASEAAVFSHPGVMLGIITGWGGTQRLPRIIGRARAMEMLATARRVSSQEALIAGLVTQVKDPVLECALAMSKESHSHL